MPKIAGGCLCGAVRYQADAEPLMTLVCHCEHCQHISGSAFSVNVVIPREALAVEGATQVFDTLSTETEQVRHRHFCPTCGSSLLSELADFPDLIIVKAGTLDDSSWVTPDHELWHDSKQGWIDALSGARVHPTGLRS